MNKISLMRHRIQELYDERDLAGAVATGEALLREHFVNPCEKGMSYADDLFNLAYLHDTLGNFERAMFLYYESAREVVANSGESLAFAYRLNNLAALLSSRGYADNAYHLLQHVTRIQRGALNADDPQLADGLYNMANAVAELNKPAEAMKLHQEALRIRRAAGDPADIVNSLHSMAFIQENRKDIKHALQYAKEAMQSAQSDDYFSAGFYLAGLYDESENFQQAENLYRDILSWVEKRADRTHSAFINVSLRLAHVLARQDKPEEALAIFEEIVGTFSKIDGEGHLFYANCLRSMAILYRTVGQPSKAEELMLQSIKIRRNNSDDTLEDLIFLFDMFLTGGKIQKAYELLVYLLMRYKSNEKHFKDAICESFAKMNRQQLEILLPALEGMDNRDLLAPIISRWEEWEKE
jgi:tetratricopeptide (TPR) repeat protein